MDPRQTLQDLIRRFGTSLAGEPQRCKGMLMDLCGSSRREIAGLVVAIEEKITTELMKPHPILVSLRANMILRLVNNRGLDHELAVWTVDTWGLVLGTWTQAELDSFPPMRGYSSVTNPVTTPRSETPIDLAAVVVEPPQLDRSQDLALTATECQRGVTKTIVLDSGKRLEVNVPAGVKMGQRVRLRGHGAVDPVTGAVGDVYLVVQEGSNPHPPTPSPKRGEGEPNLKNQTFDLPNNGGKLELIAVPGGILTMEGGHRVQLQPFLIGKYPVTQRQYQAVIGKNPSHFKGGFFGRGNLDDHPVEQVSWQDAIVFCKKLSELLKQTIDLPSETQWEWAARGATKSKGFQFAGSNNLDEVGWYDQNSGGKTHPVGQKKPNELGLYDMSGNVWEWCKDVWNSDSNVLPADGTPLTGGGDSRYRALRGGSWYGNSSSCTSAIRCYYSPDNLYDLYGFRVVLC